MNPGELKHRISIITKTQTADGIGGFTTTDSTFAVVSAAIWPVNAKETIASQQLQERITHRVRIRYLAGVTSTMKITFGSRTFNILSIINPNEAGEMLDLLCMEIA